MEQEKDSKQAIQFALPIITTGLTKSKIENLAFEAIEHVLEHGNPLQVAEALSAMEAFVKKVKANDRFNSYVREELGKNNGKLTTSAGTIIEAFEAGTSYDYSQNSEWVELEKTIASLDVRKKELEEKLKKIPAGKMLVDEESGETLIGPAKSSKSSYKVSLAK